jgi:hypothetical protein
VITVQWRDTDREREGVLLSFVAYGHEIVAMVAVKKTRLNPTTGYIETEVVKVPYMHLIIKGSRVPLF